jgi:hypothetical protein
MQCDPSSVPDGAAKEYDAIVAFFVAASLAKADFHWQPGSQMHSSPSRRALSIPGPESSQPAKALVHSRFPFAPSNARHAGKICFVCDGDPETPHIYDNGLSSEKESANGWLCDAHRDRIGRFLRMMEAREQLCGRKRRDGQSEPATLLARWSAPRTGCSATC